MIIQIKRIYDVAAPDDGYRVLVDRIWPRGLRKDQAKIDLWLREIAPSSALRRWFNHDPDKWHEFKTRYFRELHRRADLVDQLRNKATTTRLTLLYGARNGQNNNAAALKEYLETH